MNSKMSFIDKLFRGTFLSNPINDKYKSRCLKKNVDIFDIKYFQNIMRAEVAKPSISPSETGWLEMKHNLQLPESSTLKNTLDQIMTWHACFLANFKLMINSPPENKFESLRELIHNGLQILDDIFQRFFISSYQNIRKCNCDEKSLDVDHTLDEMLSSMAGISTCNMSTDNENSENFDSRLENIVYEQKQKCSDYVDKYLPGKSDFCTLKNDTSVNDALLTDLSARGDFSFKPHRIGETSRNLQINDSREPREITIGKRGDKCPSDERHDREIQVDSVENILVSQNEKSLMTLKCGEKSLANELTMIRKELEKSAERYLDLFRRSHVLQNRLRQVSPLIHNIKEGIIGSSKELLSSTGHEIHYSEPKPHSLESYCEELTANTFERMPEFILETGIINNIIQYFQFESLIMFNCPVTISLVLHNLRFFQYAFNEATYAEIYLQVEHTYLAVPYLHKIN